MTKHSKNRTAAVPDITYGVLGLPDVAGSQPVFSYHERQETQYGSKRQRLGRDSMRNFDACALCLQQAREARMCREGHIFCQECIVTSLLSQKKEIKRQEVLLARLTEEEEQERTLIRQQARERVLQDFEKLQSGDARTSSIHTNGHYVGTSKLDGSTKDSLDDRGSKRKFRIDSDEFDKLAAEHEEKALRAMEREQAEKRKAKLPNFWLPSLTPEAAPTKIADVKLQTLCHAGDPAHPMSLKSLTNVIFNRAQTVNKDGQAAAEITCPTCRRTLSNNVASYALRPCGHVLCSTCVDTLVKTSTPKQCAHCDTPLLAETKNPMVSLKREGTGYAGGGMAEARKEGVSFQA